MFARRCLSVAATSAARRPTAGMLRVTPVGARALSVEASKASIAAAVEKEHVLVFSKTHCSFSRHVKSLFRSKGVDPTVVELDTRADGAEIQALLLQMTGQRTVPNVFIKGQHIGGCDDVLHLDASKKLTALLEE